MMKTDELLHERGKTHGSFALNARFGQRLRALFREAPDWDQMEPEHQEALDYLAGKLSRILSGQARFKGHWEDVRGYAQLAEDACSPEGAEEVSPGLYRSTSGGSAFGR